MTTQTTHIARRDGDLYVMSKPSGTTHQEAAAALAEHLGLPVQPLQRRLPDADARCYEVVSPTGVVLFALRAVAAAGGAWRFTATPTFDPNERSAA